MINPSSRYGDSSGSSIAIAREFTKSLLTLHFLDHSSREEPLSPVIMLPSMVISYPISSSSRPALPDSCLLSLIESVLNIDISFAMFTVPEIRCPPWTRFSSSDRLA